MLEDLDVGPPFRHRAHQAQIVLAKAGWDIRNSDTPDGRFQSVYHTAGVVLRALWELTQSHLNPRTAYVVVIVIPFYR